MVGCPVSRWLAAVQGGTEKAIQMKKETKDSKQESDAEDNRFGRREQTDPGEPVGGNGYRQSSEPPNHPNRLLPRWLDTGVAAGKQQPGSPERARRETVGLNAGTAADGSR